MAINTINVALDDWAIMPTRAYATDAGLDIYTPVGFRLYSNDSATINTGVHVEIPEGHVGFLKSKSGLNVHSGILSEGVIDAGYTGSIIVKLYNHSDETRLFQAGDKITQLVILPIITPEPVEVKSLESTDRGERGFGSTGK